MDQIDEYEQGERVRTWLRNNGSSLITGVALGLACLGGWQWWQGQKVQQKVEAAEDFRAFTTALEGGDAAKAQAFVASLQQNHPDSPYPALAALRQAEQLAGQGKPDEALAALDGAAAYQHDPAIAELTSLRAARLLAAQGKNDEAIARLDAEAARHAGEKDAPAAFPAVAAEIRGDAEAARGNREAARDAYQKALATLDVGAPTRAMVEMKLTDAGGAPSDQPET